MCHGKTSRRPPGGERGLTLLEVVVVLAIMGLVAALSTPRLYNSWRNLQCRRAATSLASFLRYAHQQAVLTKETQVVRIDLDGLTTTLLAPRAEGPEGEEAEGRRTSQPASYRFPSTVRPRLIVPEGAAVIDTGRRDILFYPTGYSTGEVIELVNVLGTVYRIAVDPVTGSAAITRGASL